MVAARSSCRRRRVTERRDVRRQGAGASATRGPACPVARAPGGGANRRLLLVLAVLTCVGPRVFAAPPAPAAVSAKPPSAALGATRLDTYLAGLATLRVEFTQSLQDARGRKVESLAGTLVVVRPGRFRWEVRPAAAGVAAAPAGGTPPATQLMVADGRNVWFYDRELEQVTVKPASSALTATPAMLLSGTVDLRSAFELADVGTRAGISVVRVKPKRGDAEFREARLAFEGGELRRMEIDDKLGQTAMLVFGRAVRNGPVAPGETSFVPPPGVDVIGKPAS